MAKQSDLIQKLRIASPCTVGWDGMTGDNQVRFCQLCSLHVYNISEMTGAEVNALLLRTEGRLCARLYRRADGTIITRDCPTGVKAFKRRISRFAAAAFATALSCCSVVFSQSSKQGEQSSANVTQIKIQRTNQKDHQLAGLGGLVADETGAIIPGSTVSLTDEKSKQILKTVVSESGEFTLFAPFNGLYTLEVTADGFETLKIEHLAIAVNESVRVRIALTSRVLVGVVDVMMQLETTITLDSIKLLSRP